MILGLDDEAFKQSTAAIFVALLITGFVPILNLIRYVPLVKEVFLGAFVVVAFTSISDAEEGIKFSLVTGMLAAVAFNVVYIPGSIVLGGLLGAATGEGAAGALMAINGLGALMNVFGLLFMSPIGYILGGALGSVLNAE
ncbi:hypothetical protein ACFQMA_20580 [Halosimplex aquaticum]|uniref:Uncharacterized protein n=1 Tax=Halosimplex aquaticum TaxID=3026162 RepID=A0ABD5Y7C3_9EURY|nr:hypothetical protein [Halosimplex aquaticum]